jgi:preprotein translocase subunit SecE
MALIDKASKFMSEVKVEMSKVTWPTIDELKGSTKIVIILSLAFALYIFGVDRILTQLINLIY